MNLTIISNTIQIQYCRHEKFHKCITEPIIMPTSSTINSQRQEIQILELPNPYLVIPTKLKLNLVLNSDTISRSLEQTHGIPLVDNPDIEVYKAGARYVHMDPFNRQPQEEIMC